MRNHSHLRRRRAGFTLMEILLVLIILVMLGGMAFSAFSGTREQANRNIAKAQVEGIDKAARRYQLTMNAYPTGFQDLMQAPSNAKASRWAGPYLERAVPLDPWDNEYQYVTPGKYNTTSFDVWSMGPNGTSGDEDDIGNWAVAEQ